MGSPGSPVPCRLPTAHTCIYLDTQTRPGPSLGAPRLPRLQPLPSVYSLDTLWVSCLLPGQPRGSPHHPGRGCAQVKEATAALLQGLADRDKGQVWGLSRES